MDEKNIAHLGLSSGTGLFRKKARAEPYLMNPLALRW
jgi:hypothetical protein